MHIVYILRQLEAPESILSKSKIMLKVGSLQAQKYPEMVQYLLIELFLRLY